jgi:hypothetical protein
MEDLEPPRAPVSVTQRALDHLGFAARMGWAVSEQA